MNRLIVLASIITSMMLGNLAQAKDGYKIKLNLKGAPDSLVYLAHYFGKALPTIYKADSAQLKNGNATLKSDQNTLGGIYIIMLSDKKTYFEFILNNGDEMEISGDFNQLPQGLKFKGSDENERFQSYMQFLKGYGEQMQQMQSKMTNVKKKSDTLGIAEQYLKEQKKLSTYRQDYIAKYSGTLLSSIFKALQTPEIPPGKHYLPDGKEDTIFAYRYYKQHFWDGFDFTDRRLIHTPIYDAKLDEYFNKLVYPIPDSVNYEMDKLISKARSTEEFMRYTLFFLQKFTLDSKVMGMDESFVYLIENYHMKGDAKWLSEKDLQKYIEHAQKIKPNVLGNIAPPITMKHKNGQPFNLKDVKAKYTMLLFWSPTCGHCLTEAPQIDSVWRSVAKKYDVQLVAVRTEGEMKEWDKVINEKKFQDWIHVWDPDNTSNFRATYYIIATPVLYLLDEDKKIVGKKLDHSNVSSLIENLDKRKK